MHKKRATIQTANEPEVPGWREMLKETSYGPGGRFEMDSWAEVCADSQVLAFVKKRAEDAA